MRDGAARVEQFKERRLSRTGGCSGEPGEGGGEGSVEPAVVAARLWKDLGRLLRRFFKRVVAGEPREGVPRHHGRARPVSTMLEKKNAVSCGTPGRGTDCIR